MLNRLIKPLLSNSFFIFGPRGTGKSYALKEIFSQKNESIIYFDLLDDSLCNELIARPNLFKEKIPKHFDKNSWVIIDEVQRVPALLNSVHQLIEQRNIKFALTGSSARKLKRGSANLLAGRAFLNHLHPLTHIEYESSFNLHSALQWGALPKLLHCHSDLEKSEYLKSYVSIYLKQEIKEEQVIRQLDPFVRFLEVAAQENGEIVNATKIAKDALTNTNNVLRYFEILCDTLLGFYLEPYHRSIRKIQTSKAKFYFFDLGVKRAIARQLQSELFPRTVEYGRAFEHFFILECIRLNDYYRTDFRFYYLRTKDDVEIDLIIEKPNRELIAVEIKSSDNIRSEYFTNVIKLVKDLKVSRFIIACQEKEPRHTSDFDILPWAQAIQEIFKA